MRFYSVIALILTSVTFSSCDYTGQFDGKEDAQEIVAAMKARNDSLYDSLCRQVDKNLIALESNPKAREIYKNNFADVMDANREIQSAYSATRFKKPEKSIDEGDDVIRKKNTSEDKK